MTRIAVDTPVAFAATSGLRFQGLRIEAASPMTSGPVNKSNACRIMLARSSCEAITSAITIATTPKLNTSSHSNLLPRRRNYRCVRFHALRLLG